MVSTSKKAEKVVKNSDIKAPDTDGAKIECVLKGKLKEKDIPLPGMKKKQIEYKKRPKAEREKLRNKFQTQRKHFLKDLANSPDKVKQLKKAGLSDIDLEIMRNEKVPEGFQVHHKLPLDDGGDNSFDNLVLIKNHPYHKALTNLQNDLTKGMSAGDTRTFEWPVPEGFIYPP